MPEPTPTEFTQVVLYTGADGRARFREDALPLTQGTPQSMLSALLPSGECSCAAAHPAFAARFIARARRNGCSS